MERIYAHFKGITTTVILIEFRRLALTSFFSIMLRRTKISKDEKGNAILPLPEKQIQWHKVQFDPTEAKAYRLLLQLLKGKIARSGLQENKVPINDILFYYAGSK